MQSSCIFNAKNGPLSVHHLTVFANNNVFLLRVKLQSVSCNFDFPDSEYDNQFALSHTIVKEEGINLKITFAMRK